MTDKLPPQLLALFAARPPLRWLEAPDHAPERRITSKIDGVAAFLPQYKQALATDDGFVATESWLEKRDRKRREKKEAVDRLKKEGPINCMIIRPSLRGFSRTLLLTCRPLVKPNEDPNIRGDAFKTMIVARLSYEATEHDLEREFNRFGPIERVRPLASNTFLERGAHLLTIFQIRIVKTDPKYLNPSKKNKPHRGYAFVVFERERDMRGTIPPITPCFVFPSQR
jgi:U1 small nuclear ribonucleoprotein 70kDa